MKMLWNCREKMYYYSLLIAHGWISQSDIDKSLLTDSYNFQPIALDDHYIPKKALILEISFSWTVKLFCVLLASRESSC